MIPDGLDEDYRKFTCVKKRVTRVIETGRTNIVGTVTRKTKSRPAEGIESGTMSVILRFT